MIAEVTAEFPNCTRIWLDCDSLRHCPATRVSCYNSFTCVRGATTAAREAIGQRLCCYLFKSREKQVMTEWGAGATRICWAKRGRMWVPAKQGSGAIFFFQAEDGIRDLTVTGVQTCALPI